MSNGRNQNDGGYPDRLRVSDLGGADVAVCHIERAEVVNFGRNYLDASNQKVALFLAEFPGKQFVLNRTSFQLLVNRYGDDRVNGFRRWEGKLAILKKTQTNDPSTGNDVTALWIADDATWREVFAQWSRAQGAAKASADAPRRRARTK